jgi:hypothetical protein
MKDILEVLQDYIPEANPRKWARLSSNIEYRRLNLLLLKDILCELRNLTQLLQK